MPSTCLDQGAQRSSIELPPLTVLLAGVDALAPAGLPDDLTEAWLAAPLAGAPLCRRLLEPLVGLPVERIVVNGGRVARRLVAAVSRDAAFGLHVEWSEESPAPPHDGALVVLPAHGLPRLDVAALVQRAMHSGSAALALDGPGGTSLARARVLSVRPRKAPALEVAGTLWLTDCPAALRRTARAALLGDIAGLEPHGALHGDLLIGARATLADGARVSGPCAVGDASFVAARAHLGYGAVVGRRAYVHAGATVQDAVVLDDTDVAPGSLVRNEVRFGQVSLT